MSDYAAVLDRAAAGGRITPEEALDLYRSAPLHALGSAADAARRLRYAGTEHIATYIIERNINYTNSCVTACKFCAFYAAPQSDKVWTRDIADILRRCAETVELGGTQIMFQGGHHPDYGVEYYEEHFAAIKKAYPQLVIHSLGASEIEHMSRISGVTAEEAIRRIHAAGLDSFAGAGAELLPARPRTAIAPLKESGERWLEIMEIAHNLGVESTSTMLMGTGETNAERIEHLRMIRDVQDRTGGFRAFIPYTYQPENNKLKGQTQATIFEYLRLIAVARLFLDNVAHIQGSWLTVGKEVGQLSLHYGADDLGSIMLEENVVSSAGAKHRSNRMEIIQLIRSAGRVPAQRATTYEHLVVHDDPANDPVNDHAVSHLSSTAIEGGTAHPELKLLAAN
ncbi:dehypoxanthine futalosine cyclase [Streptomyces sp. SID13666]|uniref:cyclic dehypoxanthinyl futalosine synthase n=1 Tax=Streptomyces TaxID=1883 RepID=UPI001105E451|nr:MULTISPECIES: cyclic dehypoxanthinyl futalosine synthase [Streptomyces]NEA56947.1 dehypoxanthine futalosine cyclase [Streptomyces sp. SID13666]NEA74861.1 dehypoxanthine futalosine cyclase [Streptomyces sp. SID13588]MCM2420947.1 dehypoxanthine futalosine cyclase [Streptomyces sp. RKAG293]MCM2426852.1 dehypoxanthine futalosine cyclase [Streptomyces sp. RKAG337]MCZ4097044.1 dehypoxanthine futalosine cyclase [Streptomyces sp. H39-C1]